MQENKLNLGHRIADSTHLSTLNMVILRLKYPMTIVIPVFIGLLSLYSVFGYFGTTWKTGNLSIIFVPFVGPMLTDLLGSANPWLSSLVLTGYFLGPVAFYIFAFVLTKRHVTGFIASVMTMLPVNPFASEVPRRLSLAVAENDGGHVIGLTIGVLASVIFLKFIRNGSKVLLGLFLLLGIILGLVSFFSVMILTISIALLTVSEILVGHGKRSLKRFLVSVGILFTLLCLLYNASFIQMLVSSEGMSAVAVLTNLIPMTFFIIPVFGTFAFLIFDRRPQLQPLFIATTFSIVFGLLNFVRVFIVDAALFDQNRYAAEASFSFGIFLAILLTAFFDFLRTGVLFKKSPVLFQYRTHIAFGVMVAFLCSLVGSVLLIERSV